MNPRVFLLAGALLGGAAPAFAENTFTPLPMPQGNSENRTGMWFCPDLGKAADILPLKTRVWATRESVTGGVAMKCVFEKGSKGVIAHENTLDFPANSAGLTLYARASRKLTLKVGGVPVEVGTNWKKYDIPWERLGTNRAKPKLGFQLVLTVAGPIEERTWLVLDRIGIEGPQFIANPKIEPQAGPDATFSSKDMLYGAENLKKTLERAKARQPFKIIALGDSVTCGAQMSRGTWAVRGAEGVPFLYFAHLARLWEEHFGYKGIAPVRFGHPGSLTEPKLKAIEKEILAEVGPNDLVILQFGNASPATYKALVKKLVATAKSKTDQILLISNAPIIDWARKGPEISKVLQELVTEEKLAAADVFKFGFYRGEPFAWAWLANDAHPAFMGHITIAEMIAPILTGQHRTYPE